MTQEEAIEILDYLDNHATSTWHAELAKLVRSMVAGELDAALDPSEIFMPPQETKVRKLSSEDSIELLPEDPTKSIKIIDPETGKMIEIPPGDVLTFGTPWMRQRAQNRYLHYDYDKRQTSPWYARAPMYNLCRVIVDTFTGMRWADGYNVEPHDCDNHEGPCCEKMGAWGPVDGWQTLNTQSFLKGD